MLTSKRYLTVLTAVLLSACGSDNDYQEPVDNDQSATPTPTAQNFPIQNLAPTSPVIGDSGNVFVTENGLSLYFFANDEQGVSNCNADEGAPAGASTDPESCAGRWPPLLVDETVEVDAPFSKVERADGTSQWAYQGYPLYQFADDSAQGDVFGDGVGGVWYLARPMPIDEGVYLTASGLVNTVSISSGAQDFRRAEVDGFSLYTFDGDPLDVANCFNLGDGGCIDTWPPVLADPAAKPTGLFAVAEQDNGLSQWTYRGKPLYLFANDQQAGDINGQGAGGNFFLATQKPAIQRDINGSSWLTATGRVDVLTPNADGELEVQTVDKDQFSLYVFANDEPNVSNCAGDCLINWPAFLASEYDQPVGQFGIIEREGGYRQWTYNAQPLYFFLNDIAIDDINGQGVGGVFSLVPPAETQFAAVDSPLGNTVTVEGQVKILTVNESGEFEAQNVDKTGFQLYTFDPDQFEQSNCNSEGCIGTWPALLAQADDSAEAPFSLFERQDGYLQWALNDKPLYFFSPDEQAGDQFGEARGDVWWVARSAPLRLSELDNIGAGLVANRLDLNGTDLNDSEKEGFTLYTFANDVAGSGESACTGNCANVWPPLYAASDEQAYGQYGTIERTDEDGNILFQWTYQGKPLYFFTNDTQVGEANGQGVNGFQVALPN